MAHDGGYDQDALSMRIRIKRVEHSMNQLDLANAADMSQANVSEIESGGRVPRASTLVALCRALDCTPNYLLGWD